MSDDSHVIAMRHQAAVIENNAAMLREEAAGLELRANKARVDRAERMGRPSYVLRPALHSDPSGPPAIRWRASLGACKAYGISPEEAFLAFDRAWVEREV